MDQRDYYSETADQYEAVHVRAGDEHFIALEYIAGLCETVRAESVLDVGAGTGRAVEFLRERRPSLAVTGVEPVAALRDRAGERGVDLIAGSGDALPFADDSFDVVIATGVMHHLPDPSVVIAEMARVARRAVMISDANRFGQGRLPASVAKLGLVVSGLWRPYMAARTRGKGHLFSEGDGVFYSYSVYDSIPQMQEWADRVFVIPTMGPARRYSGALLSSKAGLLVAVREPCFDGWAGTGGGPQPRR